jgi:hypothetical protein
MPETILAFARRRHWKAVAGGERQVVTLLIVDIQGRAIGCDVLVEARWRGTALAGALPQIFYR